MDIIVKRIQEEPAQNDGTRVLVDRVWPRGISKQKAALDDWNKDVAPSTDLRKWYGHEAGKFAAFRERYGTELQEPERADALAHLRKWYGHDPEKFEEFSRRYREELDTEDGREALEALRRSVRGKRLTLLTASRAVDISQAVVLRDLLTG